MFKKEATKLVLAITNYTLITIVNMEALLIKIYFSHIFCLYHLIQIAQQQIKAFINTKKKMNIICLQLTT